ncbi:MAG: type I 3-dehydroquinate dehydratase, partial [Phycisphaeraceae bacterium]|nr:type I 3-dehydroquinate dehydratase [Phycisphaeraceae bacterium]
TVSILVDQVESALSDAAVAAEHGAEMIEWRIDRFDGDTPQLSELIRRSPLPCIVTARPVWEGGLCELPEADRIERLCAAAEAGPAAIDLELAAVDRAAGLLERVRGGDDDSDRPRLILSSHDFESRPADLTRRLGAMWDHPRGAIAKIAWRARSVRDNLEAFELLRERTEPTIALCMGEYGLPSRLLARKFGGFLTFASLNDQTATAPGQVSVEAMKRLYRWDSIGPNTAVYGVIGWPVGHSLSPHIFNAGFDQVGFDGVDLPLPVPDAYEAFKATVATWCDMKPLHFRGASVTIPHKQNLLRFVRESNGRIDPLTERIGAANTLTIDPDGSLEATNTDCPAALEAICEAMETDTAGLAGRRAALIGAGGVVRAIAAGLTHHGAEVVIHNRTPERAEALAADLNDGASNVRAAPMEALATEPYDLYVNGTPVGMHPNTDQTPMARWPENLGDQTVAFDTIYNPLETRWLREAAEAGCRTVRGINMFVRQAARQFERWTGQPAPIELFEQTVRKQLQ